MATETIEASPELRAFAERQALQAMEQTPPVDRRGQNRITIAVPAILQLVDASIKPLGNPFAALTRDITSEGLGLIVENELPSEELYAIQIGEGGNSACLLAQSIWCQPTGPFYLTGFKAIQGLSSMP